jgi:hypothetical protein
MRPPLKAMVANALVLATGLGIGGVTAQDQGYAATPPAYYYPAEDYTDTTAGVVYIPAPGYYNTPNSFGTPSYGSSYYGSSSDHSMAPRYGSSVSRSYGRRGGGPPNNPPYYSSGIHSLHGRGHSSHQHGR